MMNKKDITFDKMKDKHGRLKFAGIWRKSDGTEQYVTVAANHGDHVFTDDEIRALLNDETVTIKDFKSKSGDISDITGKLSPKQYMGRSYVGFERVDKNFERHIPASMQNIADKQLDDNQESL